jgi:hypothetical protein
LLLYTLTGNDARLAGTIWGTGTSTVFELLFAVSVIGCVLTAAVHWASRTPLSVRLDEEGIRVWSVLGPKSFRWSEVTRAFVTVPARDGATSVRPVLHLWSRWRDMALPVNRLFGHEPVTRRLSLFDALCESVEQELGPHGRLITRGVPTTAVTDTRASVRYLLHWPHRRILSRRAAHLDSTEAAPVDHRLELPSIALAWSFRPAPIAALVVGVAILVFARWFSGWESAPIWLAGLGLLGAFVLPLWNEMKRVFMGVTNGADLTPEMLIGHHRLDTLPRRLIPAPGCALDLEHDRIRRPDGRFFSVDEIVGVEYGPAREQGISRRLDGPWHLAVTTERDGQQQPFEIYSNASADIVKHGDLDAGYAVFNWMTARELALRSKCGLVLANGRVLASQVGQPLRTRIDAELTRYDPTEIGEEMAQKGETSTIHMHITPDRFEAWGPLARQPEHCATPPIWKLTLAAVAVASIGTGFVAGGLIAGYLMATSIHDLLTHVHFRAPGFAMDADGVWVRGVCIPWDELEESTLLPIAPGPILFAGSKSLTVAGHLGETYNDRALMGCSAYSWIRQNVCVQR